MVEPHPRDLGKPNDDGVLFWKAATPTMNPTFRRRIIDKALERDKEAATAEYLAEFRNDIAVLSRARSLRHA